MRGVVRAIDALGPEKLAHVEVEAKPVLVEDVVEGLVDMEEAGDLVEIMTEAEAGADGQRALLVAPLEASAAGRPGETLDPSGDPPQLPFFYPRNGAPVSS